MTQILTQSSTDCVGQSHVKHDPQKDPNSSTSQRQGRTSQSLCPLHSPTVAWSLDRFASLKSGATINSSDSSGSRELHGLSLLWELWDHRGASTNLGRTSLGVNSESDRLRTNSISLHCSHLCKERPNIDAMVDCFSSFLVSWTTLGKLCRALREFPTWHLLCAISVLRRVSRICTEVHVTR